MSQFLSYLPPFEGYLPKWLFLVSIVSIANSFQAYRSVDYANDLYNGRTAAGAAPSNPLSARTFGTWTFITGIVRLYAAYNITTPAVYDLAAWSFGVALAHFVGEWLGHGTAQLKGRFISPLIVASGTLTWMLTQREAYLSA